MGALNKALSVETRGKKIIYDYLEFKNNSYAQIYDKFDGVCEKTMQKHGDFIMFHKNGKMDWIEVKVEEENRHGNFFIETFSNKNISSISNHYERASTPGWIYTSRAGWIFYYFINSDELFMLPLFELKKWLLGEDETNIGHPVIDRYKEKSQDKYVQLNDTWGRCVPITDVLNQLGTKERLLRYPLKELNEFIDDQTMRAAE